MTVIEKFGLTSRRQGQGFHYGIGSLVLEVLEMWRLGRRRPNGGAKRSLRRSVILQHVPPKPCAGCLREPAVSLEFIPPQLLTPAKAVPVGAHWIVEQKYEDFLDVMDVLGYGRIA